jgi:hypothetical protein
MGEQSSRIQGRETMSINYGSTAKQNLREKGFSSFSKPPNPEFATMPPDGECSKNNMRIMRQEEPPQRRIFDPLVLTPVLILPFLGAEIGVRN